MSLLLRLTLVLGLILAPTFMGLYLYVDSNERASIAEAEKQKAALVHERISNLISLSMFAADHKSSDIAKLLDSVLAEEAGEGRILALEMKATARSRDLAAKEPGNAVVGPVAEEDRGGVEAALAGSVSQIETTARHGDRLHRARRFYSPVPAVPSCLECHEVKAGTPLGVLFTTVSREKDLQAAAERSREFVGIMILGFLCLLLVLGWTLRRTVTAPVGAIAQAAVQIASDDDLAREVAVRTGGEVGELAEAFNRMVRRLRKTRGFLEGVLESMTEGLVVTDAAGNILTLNRAARTLTGLRESEALGKRADHVLLRLGVVPGWWRGLQDAQGTSSTEVILGGKKERKTSFLLSGTRLQDEKGALAGFILVLTDITDLQAIRDSIAQAQESLQDADPREAKDLNRIVHSISDRCRAVMNNISSSRERLRQNLGDIQGARPRTKGFE